MAKTYTVTGQAAPAANADTVLYEVPAGAQFVAASISALNRGSTGSPVAIRIAIVPQGETLGVKHYIEYDMLLDVRESRRIPINIGMNSGTKVYVRADSANTSFTLGGAVITP